MSDERDQNARQMRRIRQHVRDQIERNGWGPVQAAVFGFDRDLVAEFYAVIAFTRLCVDKTEPHHRNAHIATRIRNCVGPEFIDQMSIKFGFSEARTKYLIEQHDETVRAFEGLGGGEG